MYRTNPDSLRSCPCFRVFRLNFASDFFNLLLAKFLQAEVIAMKHLIQGRNNKAWVGVEPSTLRSWPSYKRRSKPLGNAAVLHQNMIKNGKLTRPGQTNSSGKQNNKGTTRTLAVLLFAYISLPCVNVLFLVML